MKYGMTRRIDDLGRIVLPKELRTKMNLNPSDSLEIASDGDIIVLSKCKPVCVGCKSDKDLVSFGGAYVCRQCIDYLRDKSQKEKAPIKGAM